MVLLTQLQIIIQMKWSPNASLNKSAATLPHEELAILQLSNCVHRAIECRVLKTKVHSIRLL